MTEEKTDGVESKIKEIRINKLRKENTPWAPEWLNKAGAWVDANTLGVGHEATTLFKDDFKLIHVFYNYYLKQGIEHFYLYYNGKLTDLIIKEF
jgi:hypothetical protein